ncbi:response regulator transcription factor [Marinicrinis lubricantis]|uniref:Response regulator transcription factor n=1 Tax=Marinicrinis lubricantis TaxID=2086470 RepID=A0ABW1IV60_9BACL
MHKVLLVEDEKVMAKNIAFILQKEGLEVDVEHDGDKGWAAFQLKSYDLLLLDWTLPGMDGLELCRIIRKASSVPIMMITAKEELIDKVVGLEVGADDYLTKPFHQRELLARVKALLRRSQLNGQLSLTETPFITYQGLELNTETLSLHYNGNKTDVSSTEFKLLDLFMKHPQKVYTRDELFDKVWGTTAGYSDRTVDVTVSRLRKKIADLSGMQVLHAVRGLGYRFGGQE